MEFRSFLTGVIIVIYFILLILFSIYERNRYVEMHDAHYQRNCGNLSCISFCESSNYSNDALKTAYRDIKKYSEKFFGDNFSDEEANFTIFKNNLQCRYFQRKVIDEDLQNVQLTVAQYVRYNHITYTYTSYCFEPYDVLNQTKFNGHFCEENHPVMITLNVIFITIACILLAFPLTIYSTVPQFRNNFHGKMCITQLALQISMIIFFPIVDIEFLLHKRSKVIFVYIAAIFAYSINVCSTLMCYDIYVTFKTFNTPRYHQKGYWKFFFKIIGSLYVILSAFFFIFSESRNMFTILLVTLVVTLAFSFIILLAIDVLLLAFAYFHMRSVGRCVDTSENTRFYLERERFWLYVKLFLIFGVLWAVEYSSDSLYSYEGQFIANLIKTISAALVAKLLLVNPKVRALCVEKYTVFRNDCDGGSITALVH